MRSVAILGFFGNRAEAPVDDPTWEVWGLNQLYQVYRGELKWTRWFEMHALDFLKKWKPEYVDWLAKQDKPIYMQQHHDEIPCSVAYPRSAINVALGARHDFAPDYFTSTFSYMAALALHERFDRVGIYGMGLVDDGEAFFERAGLEYLIGMMQGAGIDVVLEPGSPLLKIHYVYGYTEPRMNVSDVAPVADFLKQSVDIIRAQEREMDAVLGGDYAWTRATRDTWEAERGRLRTERSLLDGMVTWLKHYGRGGALIAPDGNLTEK